MQELILLGFLILATYYLYYKLIKNRGGNCGGKGCGSTPSTPPPSKISDDKKE